MVKFRGFDCISGDRWLGMLEGLSLSNFKGFGATESMEFKPVTILCGTNSCGKSSVLQSLLLFKQTIESQNPKQSILLNGRFVRLGAFRNIIFGKDDTKKVSFEVRYSFNRSDLDESSNRGLMPSRFLFEYLGIKSKSIFLTYAVTVGVSQAKDAGPVKSAQLESAEFRLESHSGRNAKTVVTVERAEGDDSFNVTWKGLPSIFGDRKREDVNGEATVHLEFVNLLPSIVRFPESNPKQLRDVYYFLHTIRDVLQGMYGAITYLGPLREEPSRRYIYENEVLEIGNKGENAAYLYQTEQSRRIYDHHFIDNRGEAYELKRGMTLGGAVKYWMDIMGIYDFQPSFFNDIISLELESGNDSGVRVSIADVGFGVSQIFPIILAGLRMPKNNTLLLEQPEIHLHPRLQMQMADFFISLARSSKSVVVETHSDHIINRLVRRIVEDKTGELKKLINIYFVEPTGEGSQFKLVEVDEAHGIINWPGGFFDQASSEHRKIIRAGIEKRKEAVKTRSIE